MNKLAPCPNCQRHILADEGKCPFCGETQPPIARAIPPQVRRLNRSAALALGASLAAAGCNRDGLQAKPLPDLSVTTDLSQPDLSRTIDLSPPPGPEDFAFDSDAMTALYGSPPPPRDGGKP